MGMCKLIYGYHVDLWVDEAFSRMDSCHSSADLHSQCVLSQRLACVSPQLPPVAVIAVVVAIITTMGRQLFLPWEPFSGNLLERQC